MFSVHTTGNDEEATYAIRFNMPGVEGTWTLRECPVKFAGHDAAYMAGVSKVREVLSALFDSPEPEETEPEPEETEPEPRRYDTHEPDQQ